MIAINTDIQYEDGLEQLDRLIDDTSADKQYINDLIRALLEYDRLRYPSLILD